MHAKRIFIFIFLLLSFTGVATCKEKSKSISKQTIIIAKMATPVQKLYFSGTLEPLKTLPIVSPVAGNIVFMHFAYGQRIQEKQLLFVLSSSELADNYRKAIMDYLQKKQAYMQNKQRFTGMQSLYDAGAISKNDYETQKTQLDNTQLDFLQSQFELEHVLQTANVDPEKIEVLSVADTDKVNTLLKRRFSHIEIHSLGAGIALFPMKKAGSDGAAGKLAAGDTVKKEDLLLSIGDLSGLSATFNVSEVDVYRIHTDMEVKVTGSAFPGILLHGFVSSVSAQANQNGGSGGISLYAVSVKIPSVEPSALKRIRVGMTAKFEIDLSGKPHIVLPLQAIHVKNGVGVVTILDKNGKTKIVPVVTGHTTLTEVEIISGLQVGDRVVVHD